MASVLGMPVSSNFLVSSATVMLGPVASLYNLTPTAHSIGLVKNASISVETTLAELTAGFPATVVDSIATVAMTKIAAEVYEYSAKNLSYALGLDGTSVTDETATTTTTAEITGTSLAPVTVVPVAAVTGISTGKLIMITDASNDANVIVRKVSSVDTLNVTVDVGITQTIATAAVVKVMNAVDVGKPQSTNLACAITGKATNGDMILLRFPKVRVTKGFTLAFNSEQYGNLPFEIEALSPVATDTFYADFAGVAGRLFT